MSDSPAPVKEIQHADPAGRARALWLLLPLVIAVGGLALALYLREDQINQWLRNNAAFLIGQPGMILLVAFVVMIPLVGSAVYVYRLADRVVKAERMPPPGQKVIKDTPIIRGRKAVRQGRALKATAALMGLLGLLLPFGLALILMMMQKSI